ncbi:MAG TPA: hypothetical protein PK129_16535, partial [Cellvibrionaceae bacterium]|nr:hypothetical protein [Cellvibrionaceae bacterium]
RLSTVFELYIYYSDINDQHLAILSKSDRLVSLGLYSCPYVTDNSVPSIVGMSALKKLALTDTGISDKCLLFLKNHPELIFL